MTDHLGRPEYIWETEEFEAVMDILDEYFGVHGRGIPGHAQLILGEVTLKMILGEATLKILKAVGFGE